MEEITQSATENTVVLKRGISKKTSNEPSMYQSVVVPTYETIGSGLNTAKHLILSIEKMAIACHLQLGKYTTDSIFEWISELQEKGYSQEQAVLFINHQLKIDFRP
jgi:hypothetical protein